MTKPHPRSIRPLSNDVRPQRSWPLLLVATGAWTCNAPAPHQHETQGSQETEPEQRFADLPYELVEGEPMYTAVPKDGIPAIHDPGFVLADEADAFLRPHETMLGVVGPGGTAKAYSAWQLDSHEIVNDTIDGVAVAVTW